MPLQKNTQGFTLMELLVVMVIVSILFSFAALSVGSRPSPAKQAANQIQQLLKLASDEAILKGRIMGWQLTEDAHIFLQYRHKSWQTLTDDNLLRHYPINTVMELTLSIEQLDVPLSEKEDEPQVIFMPDGSFTPFSLDIQLKNTSEIYTLYTENNKILLSRPDDAQE